MGYVNAEQVLPDDLIRKIQEYVHGEFVYIPRRDGCHKAWGEKCGTRQAIDERNLQIYMKYVQGKSVHDLIDMYCLSEQSIKRIIYIEKREHSRQK